MKWEYRWVTAAMGAKGSERLDAEVNALGTDGWEAVGMAGNPNGVLSVLMKRLLPQ